MIQYNYNNLLLIVYMHIVVSPPYRITLLHYHGLRKIVAAPLVNSEASLVSYVLMNRCIEM